MLVWASSAYTNEKENSEFCNHTTKLMKYHAKVSEGFIEIPLDILGSLRWVMVQFLHSVTQQRMIFSRLSTLVLFKQRNQLVIACNRHFLKFLDDFKILKSMCDPQ